MTTVQPEAQRKVVVITGASSGLGRATALLLSRRGYRLALAARRKEELERTAVQCRALGGEAIVVPTDVTIEAEVDDLARVTLATYGAIDAWINNAGVTLFALLSEGSAEAHQRVIETNLYGAMYGARAIVPYFKERGRGVLVNVGSILSKVGQPFVPSYSMSKFALRGMTEALRAEVAEHPGVHVCSLFPYTIDTPHFQEGANERGEHARAMPPIQDPETVARALADLVDHPRDEVHVPKIAVLGLALRGLFPHTTDRMLLRALRRWHFDGKPEAPNDGNLHESIGRGAVRGTRRPQVSTPAFIAWVLKDFVVMQAETVAQWARTWFRLPVKG
jgi:NAD(P)-dependent dehydrogenase (short-subunit alcohol dehydrogenase family)